MTNSELNNKLEGAAEKLREDLAQIRTGRATPAILNNVKVNAYDSMLSMQEVGTVSVSDPTTLVIAPWDKNLIDNIAKAIRESDLQVDPIVEGDRVRISFPGLTEERRKEYAKVVSDKVEEARQRIRRVRQDAMKDIDQAFSAKEIGEDAKFSMREDAEKTVKNYNEQVEEMGESKIKEIMTV